MFHCDDFLEIIRYCLIDCISNVLKSKSIYKIWNYCDFEIDFVYTLKNINVEILRAESNQLCIDDLKIDYDFFQNSFK